MGILVGLRSQWWRGVEWPWAGPAGTGTGSNAASSSGAGIAILSPAALADQRLTFPGRRASTRARARSPVHRGFARLDDVLSESAGLYRSVAWSFVMALSSDLASLGEDGFADSGGV